MLLLIIGIPLLGAIITSLLSDGTTDEVKVKKVSLFISIFTFLCSVLLWGEFDNNAFTYQFGIGLSSIISDKIILGIDGLSLYLVLLTTFTFPICILAAWNNIVPPFGREVNIKYFYMLFLLLEALLICVFIVLDLLLFYVFFESVLIPLFLIVGIWGASINRIRASFLLFLYTLFGSLFMLLAFIYMIWCAGSSNFAAISTYDFSFNEQIILFCSIFISFAIKTPLVPFHIWLPRAHVEAPLAASMVLAGLILKLAVYGFARILIPFLPDASGYLSPIVQTVCLITLIYTSLTTIRQTDFKCLVAYSSIAHMAIVIIGLFSNTITGIEGAIILSLAHGFVSPALFMLVGGVLYDRYHTRTIRYYKGLTTMMPIFSILLFMFILGNMATPTSINWIGEFLCLNGAFQKNPITALLMSISIVLSACYSIFLYNRLAFLGHSSYLSYPVDLNYREFMVLFSLFLPTFFFGLWPNILLTPMHCWASSILYVI